MRVSRALLWITGRTPHAPNTQVAALKLVTRLAAYEGPHTEALLQPDTLAQLLHLVAQPPPPREPEREPLQPAPAATPPAAGAKGKPAPAVAAAASAAQQAPGPTLPPSQPPAVSLAAARLLAALCSAFTQAADTVVADAALPEIWRHIDNGSAGGSTSHGAGPAQHRANRPGSGSKAGASAAASAAAPAASGGAAHESEEQVVARCALLQLLAACAQHSGSRQALCAALEPGTLAAGILAILSPPPPPPPPPAPVPLPLQQHPSRSPSPTSKKAAAAEKAALTQAAEAAAQLQQPQQPQPPPPPSAPAARAALVLLVGLVQTPAFELELEEHMPALGQALLKLLEPPEDHSSQAAAAAEPPTATEGAAAQRQAAAAAAFEPICQLLLLLAHRPQQRPEQLHLLRQLPVAAIAAALSRLAAGYPGSNAGKVGLHWRLCTASKWLPRAYWPACLPARLDWTNSLPHPHRWPCTSCWAPPCWRCRASCCRRRPSRRRPHRRPHPGRRRFPPLSSSRMPWPPLAEGPARCADG